MGGSHGGVYGVARSAARRPDTAAAVAVRTHAVKRVTVVCGVNGVAYPTYTTRGTGAVVAACYRRGSRRDEGFAIHSHDAQVAVKRSSYGADVQPRVCMRAQLQCSHLLHVHAPQIVVTFRESSRNALKKTSAICIKLYIYI